MNALTLFAQEVHIQAGRAGPAFRGMSWVHIAILIMVLAGVAGIVFLVVKATGIPIPAYIWQILMIVLAVVIGCVAVIFLAGFL